MQQEENVDTKTIIANFDRAKKRIARLEKDLEKGDKKYEDEVVKAKDKYDKCFAKLVRVNEDIVKPTIEEMKELQKEKIYYKDLYFGLLKNFQVMSAILRLPTMVYQFHQAIARKVESKQKAKIEKDAIQFLQNKVNEKN